MAATAVSPKSMGKALWEAAKEGNAEQASKLLHAGAPTDWTNNSAGGLTALAVAASAGHTHAAALLLDRGADLEAKDEDGWTALLAAAIQGHRDTVELLLDSGADLEAKDRDGWTALMQVAAEGHKDTLVLLLDRGADPEAQNSDGCDSLALCKDGPGKHGMVIRSKGIAWLAGPVGSVLAADWSHSGRLVSLGAAFRWGEAKKQTTIVVIGMAMDATRVETALRWAVADAAEASPAAELSASRSQAVPNAGTTTTADASTQAPTGGECA
ncbi:hypothetical protein FNF31_07052 [Cafeteria roenbergensis]|uniref:CobW C-terminal domain-containing protein n=1 Tax=Cafeteria roenbergensis TaxID=33653 RepID=A0A5A8CCG0_CAFRO|nr:hypothetical protein FNF31_07052 [Cafeteria roenbergensis]KAA0161838.1 hypothetical protein FNF28_04903 [Cafeteria roenbergensis]